MSIKLEDKIKSLNRELNFPEDIDELNQLRDELYIKMSDLDRSIRSKSEGLTEIYHSNIRQNRTSYGNKDDKMYEQTKKVDNLVNEYNNTQILIELIEKKIDKQG